jgi:hypothetical protein
MSTFYRTSLITQITSLSSLPLTAEIEAELDSLNNIHDIWDLMEKIYLPKDGIGDGVVTEEMVTWLNTVDPGR